jgi:oligopeptide transport system ATP-binding protein
MCNRNPSAAKTYGNALLCLLGGCVNDTILLSVKNLSVHFPVRNSVLKHSVGVVKAVNGINLTVHKNETVALVGESGCGKTTAARSILRLIPAHAGEILFDGINLSTVSGADLRKLRLRMQIIFQDPVGSLDPRQTVCDIIGEPLLIHFSLSKKQRREKVAETLHLVGLSAEYLDRFPHEFSGGQRQRIGIGRALICNPDFIVCDEPVSALDVSVQAQILNLLADLRNKLGLSYLFISHNMSVVRHVADTIAVMYLGSLVEQAPCETLFRQPKHPYTKALLASVPSHSVSGRANRTPLTGETPSPLFPPTGCTFHPRCPHTRTCAESAPDHEIVSINVNSQPVKIMRKCKDSIPELLSASPPQSSHVCACWYSHASTDFV